MASKRTIADTLTLLNSRPIPQLGFGVYKSPTDLTVQSCLNALRAGYRHIDTAQLYGNEAEVGEAVRQCGIPRDQLYLTTKIMYPGTSTDDDYAKCVSSVDAVGGPGHGYVDLFLVHTPRTTDEKQRKEIWLALEKLHEEGRAKSIGVSNFGIKHIEELKAFAKVWPPHVNQIELHPWHQQKELVEYCTKQGIVIEAYCPIARNKKGDDAVVKGIADAHGVTPNHVLIRYSLQKGWVPLPKSDNPDRIQANADIYKFELSDEEMATLDSLDQAGKGALCKLVENY